MKWVFVCSGGQDRSPTAAYLAEALARQRGINLATECFGVREVLAPQMRAVLQGAQRVFVMESYMTSVVQSHAEPGVEISVLGIPDSYVAYSKALEGALLPKITGLIDTVSQSLLVNFRDPVATEEFIARFFTHDPKRLSHIQVIARNVRESALRLMKSGVAPNLDPDLAYCAALLHDVGYLDEIRLTGFHPRDGAEFLRRSGFSDLADLIEGHSCSPEEARLLNQPTPVLSDHPIAQLISYWDMRVKQGGEVVTYAARLDDILARYGAESLVGRANLDARPRLERLFAQVEELLADGESR